MSMMSRRRWIAMTVGAFGVPGVGSLRSAELRVPAGASEERFDFEAKGVETWTVVSGQ